MALHICYGIGVDNEFFDFRVWDLQNHKMVYGKDGLEVENGLVEFKSGFKDKNGRDIYAGDFVMLGIEDYKAIVCLNSNGKWFCDGERDKDYFVGDQCKWNEYEVNGHSYDGVTHFRCFEDD